MAPSPDPDGTAPRNGSREGAAGASGAASAAATAARSSVSGVGAGSSRNSISPARAGAPAPALYIAHRDDDDDHPLAPGARRARASESVRRAASAASVRSGSGGAAAGSPASPLSPGVGIDTPRGSTAANAAYTAPDADLLGIGPSRRRRDVSGSSVGGAGASSSARDSPAARARTGSYAALAPLSALDSVSRADAPLLDARFDDMTDAELARFLVSYERGWDELRATPAETAGGSDADDAPLFPPSPRGSPPADGAEREHPLRVLARAVRELRELVARLEDENAALRERERGIDRRSSTAVDERERERGPERQPTPAPVALANQRHAEQLSIHDSLVDALSTSLTSPARGALGLSSGPPAGRSGSTSPTPSAPQPTRTKSPAPSHASVRSARSARSARSLSTTAALGGANADSNPADLVSPAARKAWGGMSIWGWKRPGRKGSTASLAPSIGAAGAAHEHGEGDDDEWRRGDGGSTPAFRAIFLATRILTPDAGSILLRDAGEVGDKVASLAHALVSNARDAGITPREPPGRARARSRGASIGSHGSGSGAAGSSTAASAATPGEAHPGYGDTALAATVAVGRSLLKHGKAAIEGLGGEASPGSGTHTTPRSAAAHHHARPALLSLPSTRTFPTTAMAPALPSPGASPGTLSPSADTPPPSVELASIVPDESRPPTVLLSRQNLGSFFQSSRAKLTTATRFTSDQPPLTDRYGFICAPLPRFTLTPDDIQHASMLKDASRAGTPAPMSLTGHIPEPVHRSPATSPAPSGAERREQHRSNRRAAALPSSLHVPIMDHRDRRPSTPRRRSAGSSASSPSGTPESTTPPNGRSASDTPSSGRRRTGTMRSLAPAPARPIIAKDQLTVSVRGATGASTGAASSSTSPASATAVLDADGSGIGDTHGGSKASAAAAAASRLTVSSLLDQLTDIHDRQQKARTADWDKFLRKRTRGHRNSVGAHGREREQDVGVGGALAQIVALGGTGKGAEEYRTFLRLVRRGIPMPYRADVWAECSGARDLLVPGEYAEILAVHRDDRSPVMAEIDKDVGRTFPGNVFFGGDGPGVAKLRRVLTAYSWHNPAVGYCQGMNMLAATLLLTYTDEEQAFWVLHCIIERLLPEDYYAPSLLGSRADQLVLADLVGTHLPRIAAHLAALGVDLTVLTFGWFLSLFTDCLPVETLFRVWDVLFVEGHDVIFRVAIAILKLNEAEICACESASDLFGAISGMTSRLWSADKLIALQHSFKQAIKRADVQALMDRHSAELVDD